MPPDTESLGEYVIELGDEDLSVYRAFRTLADREPSWEHVADLERRESFPKSLADGRVETADGTTWIRCSDGMATRRYLNRLTPDGRHSWTR
jgi:hypothetical protein